MAHDVFLSHAAADRAAALAVLEGLEAAGIRCWIAPRDIPAGSEYGQQIVDAVKGCRAFVVIFSANANASPHVRREVERAVSTDRPIVPFRIENVTPTGAMEYCLGGTHWFDALTTPLEPHVANLIATLKQMLGAAGRTAEGKASQEAAERPSIAVLPFNNMSGDAEQEYFSDGITEDIITDLSKVSGLFVVARNTAFTYKGKPVKVQEVCRELGVKYVLEGSVRKAGSRVRVTGQLINGEDGGHVWADRYDRDLTDIFAIQDEITHAIVEQLKVKLLPQEKRSIAQAPTDNIEAYTYYLRGRQFLHRHTRSYYQFARRMFVKAVELDPAYARAYAGIADCDSFLYLHYDIGIAIDDILATSARALELDPGLAEAHASRGLALSLAQRYDEAMAEFERAIALDPNSYEANYFYARACFAQGKLPQAAQLLERSAGLKPDDYQAPAMLVMVYRSIGREADVPGAARKVVELSEAELGRHPENPRPAYLGAGSLIEIGEIDRAKEWLSRAVATDPDDVLTQYNVACIYSKLGEYDAAFDLLERLLPQANHETRSWVRHDADFDPLRTLPRYQKVLQLIQ
ncbi:MAG TPA: TIR domain-containing protein [Steroidobacteraceae bacterium]|nr:TIR domain-containing protein [Steroidobacteraceae bacterium]